MGYMVDKMALEQVFSEYFGFSSQFAFHDCFTIIIIIIWGWYSRPSSGSSTKWTQSHPMRKIKMHTKQYYDCQWYNRTVLDCAYALEEVAM
jgi:hypothetical protein